MRTPNGISAGGGGGGKLTLPTTELALTHTENIVLHTSATVVASPKGADITSGESWATGLAAAPVTIEPGLYAYWMQINYTQCLKDCDFSVFLAIGSSDLLGLVTSVHVPASTHRQIAVTGLSLSTASDVMVCDFHPSNVDDPSFTITSYDLFMAKIA